MAGVDQTQKQPVASGVTATANIEQVASIAIGGSQAVALAMAQGNAQFADIMKLATKGFQEALKALSKDFASSPPEARASAPGKVLNLDHL